MPYGRNQQQSPKPPAGFLREHQIIGSRASPNSSPLVPVNHSTLWRWVKLGHFPSPVKLGPHTTAWPVQVVYDWIKSKEGGV